MSITDGVDTEGGLVAVRTNFTLIIRLSDVFGSLFASGCITYTFQEQKTIELFDLEDEIGIMQLQLDNWTR